MRSKFRKTLLAAAALTFVTLSAGAAYSQEDSTPKKRLYGTTTVSSLIGGESHDSYVIRLRKGQRMTVKITWKKEGQNKAEFKVSRSANFYGGEYVRFGQTTYLEDVWNGKIPSTGNYYIYVVGHPTANYKLRVTVR